MTITIPTQGRPASRVTQWEKNPVFFNWFLENAGRLLSFFKARSGQGEGDRGGGSPSGSDSEIGCGCENDEMLYE